MNLPLVVEIAIGLVFIYLILSLLTSEIQELIATVLQWRAEHLKRSIENLLTGSTPNEPFYQKFVDEFYRSPLIQSLNQEARGIFAVAFRQISHGLGAAYRAITGTSNIFGDKKSGPSYIPPSTFSIALLQTIRLHDLSQTVSELTVRKFRDESLEALRDILLDLRVSLGDDPFVIGDGSLLDQEFIKLEQTLDTTLSDFMSGRATLSQSLGLIAEQLSLFIDNADSFLSNDHPCNSIIRQRLSYLKQSITRQHLTPTIAEVLQLLLIDDLDQSISYPSTQHGKKRSRWATDILEELHQRHPDWVHQIITLPQPLRENLLSLAMQARTKTQTLEEEVRQLEQEVADWFDRSMERASGVYRRNAKGIGLLIGFLIAIVINADTLHMIDRLAKDTVVRSSITQATNQVLSRNSLAPSTPVAPVAGAPPEGSSNVETPQTNLETNLETNLDAVKAAVDHTLDDMPLPIGWQNSTIVDTPPQNPQTGWIFWLRRLLGWTITAIALSMGASFWFDLLSKVMRVRSTGEKPSNQNRQ